MLNFNYQKFFNFNSKPIHEGLELDDDDDEIFTKKIFKNSVKTSEMDEETFKVFVIFNILLPIGLDIDTIGKDGFGYRDYIDKADNLKHFLCYVNYATGRTNVMGNPEIFRWVFDYCDDTKVLKIGNANTYPNSKWLGVSYPIIKIISSYDKGPIYFGDIHIEESFRKKLTAQNYVDMSIDPVESNGFTLPITGQKITESASFFRTIWQGQKYYLPNDLKGYMQLKKQWPNNLMIPHSFVEHLAGLLSEHKEIKNLDPNNIDSKYLTTIYPEMFESEEDFEKIFEMFCEANYPVYDGQKFYTKENYKERIKSSANDKDSEKNEQELLKYRDLLSELIGEPAMINYDKIIASTGTLNVYDLFKERKSEKDVYRKFNSNLVKMILKDNGIDIDKILEESENRTVSAIIDFIDLCIEHNIDYEEMFYQHRGFDISHNNAVQNTIAPEILPKLVELGNNISAEISGISRSNAKEICLKYKANSSNMWPAIETCVYKSLNPIINHELIVNGEDKLLARFYYLLNKKCAEYALAEIEQQQFIGKEQYITKIKNQLSEDTAFTTLTSNINVGSYEYGYRVEATPFNLGNIDMSINDYKSLYKFITFIVYAIENGYDDIKTLNICFASYNNNSFNLSDEFTTNSPDMATFVENSLAKGLQTQFKNIANKVAKK